MTRNTTCGDCGRTFGNGGALGQHRQAHRRAYLAELADINRRLDRVAGGLEQIERKLATARAMRAARSLPAI